MPLFNTIPISTSSGFKTIEIHHDDLTNLEWPLNVLVISAYRLGYHPTPGTLIAGLHNNRLINVQEFADQPLVDLRSSIDTWVSAEIPGQWLGHIVCIEGLSEIPSNPGDMKAHLKNLMGTLSLMSMKGIDVSVVGMPLLAMGRQGMSIDQVLPHLLESCSEMLEKIRGLKTIQFVHYDINVVSKLDNEINSIFKRNENELEFIRKSKVNDLIIEQIVQRLHLIKKKIGPKKSYTIQEMIRNIENEKIRNSDFALSARKVLEFLLTDLQLVGAYTNEKINSLNDRNVSKWIISYFHLVRTFCNCFVHKPIQSYVPEKFTETDIKIFLESFLKILDFYLTYRTKLKVVPKANLSE